MRRSGGISSTLEIGSICGMYVGKDGRIYYQVQWLPSWENKSDLVGCEKFIQEFHMRQEKEIFGKSKPDSKLSCEMEEMKTAISSDITEFRNNVNDKLQQMEELINKQHQVNEQFTKRLVNLESSSLSVNRYYYDQNRQQPVNMTESELVSVQSSEESTSREKEEDANELYYDDMLYNEYMEGSIEPRRKRSRVPGDIAVGIPVNVDAGLISKVRERLEVANSLQKEAEVVHALRVSTIRHILALKLAQIIYSDEELAAASYAPGNFKPLDEVKLTLIEELSFMRFAPDESEIRDVSWAQIHQRIKNKCRCKRKIHNDKLMGLSYKATSPGTSSRELVTSPTTTKFSASYGMGRGAWGKTSTPYRNMNTCLTSSTDIKRSGPPQVFDLTGAEINEVSTSRDGQYIRNDNSNSLPLINNINDTGDGTIIVFKEDETDDGDDA